MTATARIVHTAKDVFNRSALCVHPLVPITHDASPALLDGGVIEPAIRLNPDLPPKLEEMINKVLEKDRELRYQHAERETESGSAAVVNIAAGKSSRLIAGWKLTLSAGVVAIALAAGVFFYSHRPTALTDKDTIVLADFDNRTGDPVFDNALKQALLVQLEQSPFLNVLSDQKVNATSGAKSSPTAGSPR